MTQEINYIGVFLTFRCNLGCEYCLNRQGNFRPRKEISVAKWLKILEPIETREDLPISLQGGEPTMYPGFYELTRELFNGGKRIDVLTNGDFYMDEFLKATVPEMFRRQAPYASIRFSLHQNTNDIKLLRKVTRLHECGYSVGIWGLDHPDMRVRNDWMRVKCERAGVDFRTKEFLDATHGTYKYPDAVTGIKNRKSIVECWPSELLFAPDGKQYPCHHFLYSGKKPYIKDGCTICQDYGLCNPCDVKLKTNRLQEGGHCSVRIGRTQ